MTAVTSQDATTIAFDRIGRGAPLILVDGALCDRSGPNRALAALLAEHFTVYTYDRRGRGDSGDRTPYAIEREVEDLQALVEEAGGAASVFGISSGAVLALEAAERLTGIEQLVLYEPPFVVDDSRAAVPPGFAGHLAGLVAAGRRGDAVRAFMTTGVQVPRVFVALMGLMPMWKRLKAIAHTLPYDLTLLEGTQAGMPLPHGRWSAVTAPTLVIGGGKSPDWLRNGAVALAELLGARHRTLAGQTHMVKPKVLAPVIAEFLGIEPDGAAAPRDAVAAPA